MADLGSLGGEYSIATDINTAGQVAGWSNMPDGNPHAFTTRPNETSMTDLGTLGGNYSRAYGINDKGQVVGESVTASNGYHAFIAGPDELGMVDITLQRPARSSEVAWDINTAGQVVGNESIEGFITGPNGADRTWLSQLGNFFINPYALNDSGRVVGGSTTLQVIDGRGVIHAFITGPDGMGITDLGTLGGHDSQASDINNSGRVVGFSDMPDGTQHAFITGPDGVGMTDLNSLVSLPEGVILANATAINNVGQVVATAVPEPERYALLLLGLGLIAFMARGAKEGAR
jgi:probable HAF family extracellular repeat protein